MRYRVTNGANIPPAAGEAEKLIANLAADYRRFYEMQERVLRGKHHPLEDFARKIGYALSARLRRVSRPDFVRAAAWALFAAAAILALWIVFSALPKEAPKETVYAFSMPEAPVVLPEKALDETSFLNRATADELTQIQGIGEALAARIVAEREKNGFFAFMEDIFLTPGIGQKKLNAIQAYMETLEN